MLLQAVLATLLTAQSANLQLMPSTGVTCFAFWGGPKLHERLGPPDTAEGNLAQPLQLDVADCVPAQPLCGRQLTQSLWKEVAAVAGRMLMQKGLQRTSRISKAC